MIHHIQETKIEESLEQTVKAPTTATHPLRTKETHLAAHAYLFCNRFSICALLLGLYHTFIWTLTKTWR